MCFMQIELVLQTKNWSELAKNRFSAALVMYTPLQPIFNSSQCMGKGIDRGRLRQDKSLDLHIP